MKPTTKRILAGLLLITPAALSGIRKNQVADVAATGVPVLPAVEVIVAAPEAQQNIAQAAVFAEKFNIPTTLARHIHSAAKANGIPPRTAFGLVRAESSFRSRVVSPVGAVGLTQVMPATARWLEPGTTRKDLMRPETNLRIGFKYLRSLIDRYDGNERLALTAFNRGPGTVDKLLKRGRNPDNGYFEKVTTGKSRKHVALMNKKFGGRHRRQRA